MKENNVVTSEANRKLCQGWEHDDFQRKQCTNQKNRPFGLYMLEGAVVTGTHKILERQKE